MKTYRRLLSAVLATLMLCALLPMGVFAAYEGPPVETNITFSVDQVTVDANATTVTVALWITNLTDEDDLGVIDFRVGYDDTKLKQTDIYAEVGSGRNKVYYSLACFEGGYQTSPPGGTVNPIVFLGWTTATENPCYDSVYEFNTVELAFIDFEFIGDWQGRTPLTVTYGDVARRSDSALYESVNTVDGWIQRGEYTEPDPELESIAVTTAPTKTDYLEGKDDFDPAGGKLTLTYDNSDTEEIDLSEAAITGFDNTVLGTQTLTATYEGLSCTFDVTVVAKSLESIAVTTLPTKTEYVNGYVAEFDPAGGKITLTYDNDTTEEIDLSEATIDGFYNDTDPGTQTVTVTYGGKSTTFDITIIQAAPTGITVSKLPDKVTYLEGKDELDLTGGEIEIAYNNPFIGFAPLSDATVTGFDNTVVGTQALTVSYLGFTTTFEVEVVAKELESIAVTTAPTKAEYLQGEALDLAGGIITLTYNNDDTAEIDLSEATVTGYDADTLGTQTLTATYEGKSATFDVVVSEKAITSIEITTLPTKLSYKENKAGERELDLSGGILTVTYEDSTTDTVALTEATATGFDTFTPGTQTITVTYAGKTDTFEVTVVAKVPVRIVIVDEYNIQKEYLEGKDELCISGPVSKASLQVVYDNDTYDGQELKLDMITGFDNTVVGVQTLTVTYQGIITTFDVEIIAKSPASVELTTPPTKTEYLEAFEDLDLTGGVLHVNYNNDTEADLPLTDPALTVTGFDNTVVGTQTLTVTLGDVSTTFDVTVTAKSIESISVTTPPIKTQYILGETEFDPAGGIVTIFYNNDTSTEIALSEAEISGFDTSALGEVTLTVTYEGFTATQKITVVDKEPLVITTQPESVVVAYKDTATVSVEAEGEDVTYTWYYKDKGMADFAVTNTFKGDTYSVVMNGARSGRQIYCVVTDKYDESVQSDVVTISMEARIAVHPQTTVVAYGETVTVSFEAEGEGLTYKWYYKNRGATKFVRTYTFDGDTYTAEMNGARTGRQIYCVVTDQFGNTVATKIVTIAMEARIATQPQSVTVAKGKIANVKVKAQGEGLKYTWYYKDAGAKKFVKTNSFKGSSYYVYMNDARDGRELYCVVTDAYGNTVTTETVTINQK